MIKITIERISTENYKETKNFITKKTPTDKVKQSDYGNKTEVAYAEEYATSEVPLERKVTTILLTQEIQDESQFELKHVVRAINNL